MTYSVTQFWQSSSKGLKLGLGIGLLALLVGVGFFVHRLKERAIANLTKESETLKQDNRRITDEYWEAIGERNALRVQAQQAKLEADAYRQVGEQRGANVKALDEKINVVRGQYDEIQTSVGDCSSVADCRKQLCAKYKQAGVKLSNCPD